MSAIKIALLLFSALTISHALPMGPGNEKRQKMADVLGGLGEVVIKEFVPNNHQEMSLDIGDLAIDIIEEDEDADNIPGRVEELIVKYVPEEHSEITAELLEVVHLVEDQLDEERIEEIRETVEEAANKAIEYFLEDDRTKDQVKKASNLLVAIAEEIIKLVE